LAFLCAILAVASVSIAQNADGNASKSVDKGNVLRVWKERLNAHTRVTTPNSDCLYAMGYINIGKDGPIVVEIPPRMQGILDDFFQRPLEGPTINGVTYSGDIGFPGPDAGKGGKYLIVRTAVRFHGRVEA
jgi:hypothetical protein